MDQLTDFRTIRMTRKLRNLTLAQFSEVMRVDAATLSKIEAGHIQFSPLYQSKFREACKELRINSVEIASIRLLLELQEEEKC